MHGKVVPITAGGLEIAIENGTLKIIQEGKTKKFVKQVDQITFSGKIGSTSGQEIFYMTERCVFKLKNGKVELIEVAPGIDIETDILAHMDFRPVMNNVRIMDHRIFKPSAMGIRREFLKYDIEKRCRHLADHNALFVNLKGLEADNAQDIEMLKEVIEKHCAEAAGKIKAVAAYALDMDEELMEAFLDLGGHMKKKYGAAFSLFANREEMREKLGGDFVKHALNTRQAKQP